MSVACVGSVVASFFEEELEFEPQPESIANAEAAAIILLYLINKSLPMKYNFVRMVEYV